MGKLCVIQEGDMAVGAVTYWMDEKNRWMFEKLRW